MIIFLKTPYRIAIALGLTLIAPLSQAEHIDMDEAQHLLQWDQRQQFFESWLTAKQQSTPLLKGLILGHSEAVGNYRTTRTLAEKHLTVFELNRLWLIQAIKAYQRKDWLGTQHALSQLQQPLGAAISGSATLLQQATTIRLQQPARSAEEAVDSGISALEETQDSEISALEETEDSGISALIEYNQALALINNGQTSQAITLTTQLQHNPALEDAGLVDRARLLSAYSLTQQPARALNLLQDFSPSDPLFSLKVKIENHIHLSNADEQSRLDLLLKQSQQSPQQLSTINIQLLEELRRQGAHTQAAVLAGEWLPPLQQQRADFLKQVEHVNSQDFLEQLAQRQSGDPVTKLESFLSKDSRLLLSEIERNNFLLNQLSGQIPFIQPELQLFQKGRYHLNKQLQQFRASVPNIGTRLPDAILQGDPAITVLENRLSGLVGQPQPWLQRYILLDGIAIWHTGTPFKHRWWEPPVNGEVPDLNAAKQELSGFAAEQFSQTVLLEEIRAEQNLPKLPQIERRAIAIQAKLVKQKNILIAALAKSLQFEPTQMLAELENNLLWLSTLVAPRTHQFDQSEQQRLFTPGQAKPSVLPAETRPPYELALSAFQMLTENALNSSVQNQALRHLADLKLLISDQILNGDSMQPRADINPDSAISLYLELLERPDSRINKAQIYYQLAKSYELNGQPELSLAALQQLIHAGPDPLLLAEIRFRIAEMEFRSRDYDLAAESYQELIDSDNNAQFIDKARYKLAWSAFKQSQYLEALDSFFILVERHWQQPGQVALADEPTNTKANKALLDDTLRVIALTFAYMDGARSVQQYFSQAEPKPYEFQVYLNLGAYFEYKHRYTDAAEIFSEMVQRFPNSNDAPELQSRVISAYTDGGFPSKSWPAREYFIERFGVSSQAWRQADPAQRARIWKHLAGYLAELAQRDHALAQALQTKTDPENQALRLNHYKLALTWYEQFTQANHDDPRMPDMLFMKAEALTETDQIPEAAATYKQVAYQHPNYSRSAEAGYAALLAYQGLYLSAAKNSADANHWLQQGIDEGRLFSESFPDSIYAIKTLVKLAEDLFIQNEYRQAIATVSALQQNNTTLDDAIQQRLWRISSHAYFEIEQYLDAEQAYQQLLLLVTTATERKALVRRLAESIYQQGEQAQRDGSPIIALEHYQRLGRVVPGAHILPQADFDAATILLKLKRWPEAVAALQRFSQDYPGHPLQATIDDKRAVAYEQTENWPAAAQVLQRIFEREGSSALGRDALWRSAALQEKANKHNRAIMAYERFIEAFPNPHEPAMEAHLKLYQLAKKGDNNKAQQHWLEAMVAAEIKASSATGEETSTDRSLFIASEAALILGKQAMAEFQSRPLDLPLDKSLPRKRESMQTSIRYLTQTSNFGLSAQGTLATALIGQLYQEFAQALMSSERPHELDELALEQYEILLEEQALPFEDQAISLHEINVGRISQEIYTPGIASSLVQLRQMMPARYAKDERVPEYSDALE
ncbi:MAG: tetratricopeptide repeat protein [Motiliproteus sp.]